MTVVSIVNQKGGVGKSTSSIELAYYFATQGLRTCLVDLDPQGNSTRGVGIEKAKLQYTIADLFKKKAFKRGYEEIGADKVVINRHGIDVYPNNIRMAKAIEDMGTAINKESLLKHIIEQYFPIYDIIILDCPPQFGFTINNALIASDLVLIPVCADVYSMEGVVDLLDTIEIIKGDSNPNLEIGGVFLTKVRDNTNIFKNAYEELKLVFAEKMMKSYIRMGIGIDKAIEKGVPVLMDSPDSKPGQDYLKLGKELLYVIDRGTNGNSR